MFQVAEHCAGRNKQTARKVLQKYLILKYGNKPDWLTTKADEHLLVEDQLVMVYNRCIKRLKRVAKTSIDEEVVKQVTLDSKVEFKTLLRKLGDFVVWVLKTKYGYTGDFYKVLPILNFEVMQWDFTEGKYPMGSGRMKFQDLQDRYKSASAKKSKAVVCSDSDQSVSTMGSDED